MLAVSPGEGDYFRSFSPPLRTTLTRLRERDTDWWGGPISRRPAPRGRPLSDKE